MLQSAMEQPEPGTGRASASGSTLIDIIQVIDLAIYDDRYRDLMDDLALAPYVGSVPHCRD